jgi:hypothetical protein
MCNRFLWSSITTSQRKNDHLRVIFPLFIILLLVTERTTFIVLVDLVGLGEKVLPSTSVVLVTFDQVLSNLLHGI